MRAIRSRSGEARRHAAAEAPRRPRGGVEDQEARPTIVEELGHLGRGRPNVQRNERDAAGAGRREAARRNGASRRRARPRDLRVRRHGYKGAAPSPRNVRRARRRRSHGRRSEAPSACGSRAARCHSHGTSGSSSGSAMPGELTLEAWIERHAEAGTGRLDERAASPHVRGEQPRAGETDEADRRRQRACHVKHGARSRSSCRSSR